MQVFSFMNIDFIPWQSVACSFTGYSYYMKLILITLIPIGVFVALVVFFLVPTLIMDRFDMDDEDENRNKRLKHRSQFFKLVCFSIFLMYPTVSSSIFAVFECKEVNGSHYLISDFTIYCYDDPWTTHVGYAVGMMLLYPIGVPVVLFCILYKNRNRLYTDKYVGI